MTSSLHDWLKPDWPAPPQVQALMTDRHGGVSQAPWDSMNLGDHVGDVPHSVQVNRQRLQAAPDGRQVRFCVKDTGCGIPSDDLPRIFERLYRAETSRNRDHGGSGLGVLRAAQTLPHSGKLVVLSNYATPDMRRKCLQLGADKVFDKSNEIDALITYCQRLSTGEPTTVHGDL